MHTSISKSKIILNHNILKMKFKLIKDKEFFQIVCDKKSVKEITDGENKAYEIEWYASTKDKDRMNDIVEPTAFENTLKQYMTNPIVLLQHDMDKPIWNVIEASIDDKGLFIKAKITEDTDGVFSKLKNWVLRTFSIWYRVKDFETMENEDAEWNYVFTNVIKELELFEISLVSVPANPFALVKSFDSCFKAEEEIETAEEPKEEEAVEDKADNTNENPEEENHQEEDEEAKEEENEECSTDEEIAETVEEEKKEIGATVEWEVVEWEEVVEDESTESESEEKSPADEEKPLTAEDYEKTIEAIKKADENSEISAESNCDDSENDSETESNDEVVDETSNDEVVEESKSMEVEHKGIEKAEFNSFVKSFNQKLDEKDEQIKKLQTQIANQNELMKWAIEVMIQLEHAVKNTAIQSWSSYQAPASKSSWQYGKIAQLLKKANS